ncbi:TonB-dependent receptor [Qipengyuania sp. 1NDW9]|uniref:TonB-dependent receptor n=1 Tax=Qipengyuania xiapuensis TaxID=2867236 RepID=A0ABX8ZYD9_9SPHN|nr:TonB-dependent receptor [Qipengyuania xiapuensis]MBX7493779.1 TonB-dependent receptor [Qipengyuania xiapuensis]QZD92118.1 TonB-dependent receptor [Qipengyuania xiapuensis]
MSYRFTKASLLTGTVMAGAMIASPALAQADEDPALESGAAEETSAAPIVVTGSRIARRNVETAAPVAVVNAEEFKLSGTVNVENVVNTLPQVVPGVTSFSNNPGNGTASLNLRGLGATRTLLLVNGRRWKFYDANQITDLNTIPQFLLDSVDVVTGGASAVYGSDAMAGVVNFRLRELDGAEVGGQYSITERGDGARYQVHGAVGSDFADGRGNVTAYAEYYNREEIFQGDRDFSEFALGGSPLVQLGSSLPPATRLTYRGDADTVGSPFDSSVDGNPFAIFNADGSIREYDNPGDLYNYAPVNYLQLPQERYLLGGNAAYEISSGLELYGELSYSNNRVDAELAPTPILVNTFLDIDSLEANGFVDAATIAAFRDLDANETGAAQNDGLIDVQVRRRLLEAGGRRNLDERNAFRLVTGARGAINDYLSYDAYYMFARTRNANIQQGNASVSRFTAGVNGTGPTPINIFGPNTLTPAMVDSFRIQAQNGDISKLQVLTGVVSGTFGDFALGEAEAVGFAIGAERRIVEAQFLPDEFLASGDVAGFNAGSPTSGGYDVNEVFAELNIPFETESGFRVELTGAGRYSDYSLETVGGVWTYAGGIQIQPIPDITFRGQYQRAVRAPNVNELFQGTAIGFPGANDPCAGDGAGNGPIPTGGLLATCLANGVPQANIGNNVVLQPDGQIAALFGGNPNLEEETSDSYSFGVVLEPSFIPGLTITADYFDITIDNAITTISLQQALDLCYNQAQDLSDPRCLNFVGTRDADGAFGRTNPPVLGGANIAEFSTSGVDLQVNYGTDVGFSLFGEADSRMAIQFLGTWTESNDFIPDVTDTSNVVTCAGEFGLTCGEPQASFKWTSRFSWSDGPVTTSVRWRHLSAVEDDDPTFDYHVERIDAYDLIDLTVSVEATDKLTLSAGINNLFDTLPSSPEFDASGTVINDTNSLLLGDFNNSEQANTYPSTYDVLGRDFFFSAQFRF